MEEGEERRREAEEKEREERGDGGTVSLGGKRREEFFLKINIWRLNFYFRSAAQKKKVKVDWTRECAHPRQDHHGESSRGNKTTTRPGGGESGVVGVPRLGYFFKIKKWRLNCFLPFSLIGGEKDGMGSTRDVRTPTRPPCGV